MAKRQFLSIWHGSVKGMVEQRQLTMPQWGIVFCLATTIHFRDNVLRNPDTGFPFNKKDMAEFLGLNYDYLRKEVLPVLMEKNIIRFKDKCFILNPDIAWKGKSTDIQFIKTASIFREEIGCCEEMSNAKGSSEQ